MTLERFKKLCLNCLYHQIYEQLPIEYLYERLLFMDWNIMDMVSGGAFIDKTLVDVKNLIGNMSNNSQPFTTRRNHLRQGEI